MITKIVTTQELKQIFLEILLNKTDKVTDIGQDSVLNGIAFGCAKIGQKLLTNQAIIEGHLFPDSAYGEYLDAIAFSRGVSPRFAASGSATYIRLVAVPGTTYLKDTHTFISTAGVSFSLLEDVTIGSTGYAYAAIQSIETGYRTNVDPISINRINPALVGHVSCTNEYRATGGNDAEEDEQFRDRIKQSVNQLARGTISYLEQIFIKINPRVLRVYKNAIDANGYLNLTVVPVNGVDFSQAEFDEIVSKSQEFLSLSDMYFVNDEPSIKLNNVTWIPIDVDFRADLDPSIDVDLIRLSVQIEMGKMFDYRSWKFGDRVEWDNLLFAAKGVSGVRYIPDSLFFPQSDINIPLYSLPRIRGFVMRDMSGNVIADNSGVLNDFFYPNEPDYNFQGNVIQDI